MSLFSSFLTSLAFKVIKKIKKSNIPSHVAIIMDGNGRWAVKRNLPRTAGHQAGSKSLKKVIISCMELGIKYLTVFSFSSENWQRPQDEVNFLIDFHMQTLNREFDEMNKNGISIRLIGDRKSVPPEVLSTFDSVENKTRYNNKLILNIAFNYGSRIELIEAIKKIVDSAVKDEIKTEEINEELISKYLYTGDCPDPDLLIRTSGEYRISNFLLWQIAYTELYFTRVLWPDFGKRHFLTAILNYQRRDRRFGKIKKG